MMEGEQEPQGSALFVVATYRDVADRWGLKTNDHARMKAKRAGWEMLPQNHPGDAVRVRVPRTEWDAAQPAQRRANKDDVPQGTEAWIATTLDALKDQLRGEQQRRQQAEEEAAQAAALRERVARLEGEAEGLRVALQLAERMAQEVAHTAERMAQEATAVADQRAQQLAQAEAQRMEMERRALLAEKEAAERMAQVERLRGRGWLARLLGVE